MTEQTAEIPGDPAGQLRQRCTGLSLLTWRCDSAGAIVEEPDSNGLIGLWARSGMIRAMITAAARDWARRGAPRYAELFPGCWAIPIRQKHRRRQVGQIVALALCPAALDSQHFESVCASAHLDAGSVRCAFRSLAVHDCSAIPHLSQTLSWIHADLIDRAQHRRTLDGFAHQLTESYETISVLFSFGRSMRNLADPLKFGQHVCNELHSTLTFRWLAIRFVSDPRMVEPLTDRLLVAGDPPGPAHEFDRITRLELERLRPDAGPSIGPDPFGDTSRGAFQVLTQPVICAGRLSGAIFAGDKQGADPQPNSYDSQLIESAAAYLGVFLETASLYANQQAMFFGTLRALTASIDAKDRYTCGHSERVALLASQLATVVGMDAQEADRVQIAGLVHDVGKIGVPEAVLTKPGKLTEAEFEQIRAHPAIGHNILRDIPMLEDVLPGVLHHHERWDGRGYPHGLSGQRIPYIARIICLADTFDAMSSTRAYRDAMPRERALQEIIRCAGTQFDPELAQYFLNVDLRAYDEMVARHGTESRSEIQTLTASAERHRAA